MTEYGLGRRPAPDDRDRRFLMRTIIQPAAARPAYRYFKTGPVLDQGSTPQCVGYSWRLFLTSAPVMTKGGPDATTIYRGAQEHDEWPGSAYDGSSVRGGAKYLQGLGIVSSYVWAFDAETVADFILSGHGSVVAGTWWYTAMFTPDARSFLKLEGRIAGGHAWLVVGYSRARGVFRMQNSWGAGWGERGRAWITGEDFGRLLAADGEACAAYEAEA